MVWRGCNYNNTNCILLCILVARGYILWAACIQLLKQKIIFFGQYNIWCMFLTPSRAWTKRTVKARQVREVVFTFSGPADIHCGLILKRGCNECFIRWSHTVSSWCREENFKMSRATLRVTSSFLKPGVFWVSSVYQISFRLHRYVFTYDSDLSNMMPGLIWELIDLQNLLSPSTPLLISTRL